MTRDIHKSGSDPLRTGIGLRGPHVATVLADRPTVSFFEVHAENYMDRGTAQDALLAIRRDYPVSLHAVGLSLGSAEGIDRRHLARLKDLAAAVEPVLISDHLSWSVSGGAFLNDLLPLPYTEEALVVTARAIAEAQDVLKRRLLIENPSSYLRFRSSTMHEADFLAELVRRTGCALLCDVNNIIVSAHNLALDPSAWLDRLPADAVAEIHLAGHHRADADGRAVLIDDHGDRVAPAVWYLYARAVECFGPVPTLIEWDSNLPSFGVLIDEARKADRVARTALTEARHARAA
jgi:uncharacterized protein (UPF0276 family)